MQHCKCAQIADDSGIHAHFRRTARVLFQLSKLIVIGKNIQSQIKTLARLMNKRKRLLQRLPVKVLRRCTQAKPRQAAVYSICAKSHRCFQLFHSAGGRKQFHSCHITVPLYVGHMLARVVHRSRPQPHALPVFWRNTVHRYPDPWSRSINTFPQ